MTKALTGTSIGLCIAGLALFIVNIAFPALSRSFDYASLSGLPWVLDGYASPPDPRSSAWPGSPARRSASRSSSL